MILLLLNLPHFQFLTLPWQNDSKSDPEQKYPFKNCCLAVVDNVLLNKHSCFPFSSSAFILSSQNCQSLHTTAAHNQRRGETSVAMSASASHYTTSSSCAFL